MNINQPTILILVGITGDLAGRKLVPSIAKLAADGVLGNSFRLVGTSRRELTVQTALGKHSNDYLQSVTSTYQLDPANAQNFNDFKAYLQNIEQKMDAEAQKIFYLSVPPNAMDDMIDQLAASGLTDDPNTKLMLEKPFGDSLESAQKLVDHITKYFTEEQLFLIDHYLAKEMVQNLMTVKANNAWLAASWNDQFISAIDVTISETLGLEGRANFYEQTGALKDVLQSHLLQLLASTLLPANAQADKLPILRQEILESIYIPEDSEDQIVRGQYNGYKEEAENQDSSIETYVRLPLRSSHDNWANTALIVSTGKALSQKLTQITVSYIDGRILTITVDPGKTIKFDMAYKPFGYENLTELGELQFDYDQTNEIEAYQRVFLEAMLGSHSLFVSTPEILAQWTIVEPVLTAWKQNSDDIIIYEPGAATV